MMTYAHRRTGVGRWTLDQILRQNAQRMGHDQALADAPDRPLWTSGPPRRMSWAQVDAAASAIAGRFVENGLPAQAIVCIQGLNTVDTLLAILGCARAGLVAAMLPPVLEAGRTVTMAQALGASAILAVSRIGQERPLQSLQQAVNGAAPAISFIGAFGADIPDGIVSLEDCITLPGDGTVSRLSRRSDPLDSLAIITFDGTAEHACAVARTHRELITCGMLFAAGLNLRGNARLLSAMMPLRLAGLASGLVAWLLSGSQLVLHQAFDSMVFGVQLGMHAITHTVVPDIMLHARDIAPLLSQPSLEGVAILTREPHRILPPPPLPVEISYFASLGETGILPGLLLPDGHLKLPDHIGVGDESATVETLIDESGFLQLRGDEIPTTQLDTGTALAPYPLRQDGWVCTGYAARQLEEGIIVTGPRHALPQEPYTPAPAPISEDGDHTYSAPQAATGTV